MKRASILGVAFAFLLLIGVAARLAQAQKPGENKSPSTETLKASGCVKPGVEAGCLILVGLKDKKTYNLFFSSGKKPAVGTAISFQGRKHDGPTICMEGTPVRVTSWTPLKMKCP